MKCAFATVAIVAVLCVGMSACVTEFEGTGPRVASDAQRVQAQIDLGRVYLQKGDLESARAPLMKALEIDSSAWEAHDLLAALFVKENDPERAEAHWRNAVRSGGARPRNNYAAFLMSRDRVREACQQLSAASNDLNYDLRAQVFENLGLCERRLGNDPVALDAFEHALAINGGMPVAQLETADLLLQQGKTDAAWSAYQQYRQLARPTSRSLWVGIQLSRARQDLDAEASFALLLRSEFPNSAEYQRYQETIR